MLYALQVFLSLYTYGHLFRVYLCKVILITNIFIVKERRRKNVQHIQFYVTWNKKNNNHVVNIPSKALINKMKVGPFYVKIKTFFAH